MSFLKGLFTMVWAVSLLVVGCVLYLYNPDPVAVDLVWVQSSEQSLAIVLISAFFIGVVSGSVLTLIASIIPTQSKKQDV